MSVTELRSEEGLGSRPEDRARRRTEEQENEVRRRRINRLERRWWGRKAVNLFIVWHLFALAIWQLPFNSAIVPFFASFVRPYVVNTGFAQSWSMFSPYPDKLDVYLEAQITYADGEKRSWFFPRMVHMGYAKKYEEERWRKLVEVSTHGGNQMLWPALARYAARVNDYDTQNPPTSVELIQHSRTVPPPGQPIPPYAVAPLQTNSGPSITVIRPEDLK